MAPNGSSALRLGLTPEGRKREIQIRKDRSGEHLAPALGDLDRAETTRLLGDYVARLNSANLPAETGTQEGPRSGLGQQIADALPLAAAHLYPNRRQNPAACCLLGASGDSTFVRLQTGGPVSVGRLDAIVRRLVGKGPSAGTYIRLLEKPVPLVSIYTGFLDYEVRCELMWRLGEVGGEPALEFLQDLLRSDARRPITWNEQVVSAAWQAAFRIMERLRLRREEEAEEMAPVNVARGPESASAKLAHLLENHPLLGDLHVHLLGAGDAAFWRRQMLRWPDTAVDSGALGRVPEDRLPRQSRQGVLLGDLATDESLLSGLLEMSEPAPGGFELSFSPLLALRKYVAWKHPECLTALISTCAQAYREDRVHYVEYSLGAGWFREPYLSAVVDGIEEARCRSGVLVRLLIAFNRGGVSTEIHDANYLASLAGLGDRKLRHTTEQRHYEGHLSQLQMAAVALDANSSSRDLVVGVDLMGNETCRPYAPFLLPDFLGFASAMRERNPNFGFRLHLGEGISSNDDIGYVSLRLGEHYIWTLAEYHGFRVRCGHGLGLLGLDTSAFNRWRKQYPTVAIQFSDARRILENLRMAPVEVNLTSNYYLMGTLGTGSNEGRSLRAHPMRSLLDRGFRLVLGTDDPGVFPKVTLRGEYRLAHRNGLLRSAREFHALVEESVRASFASPKTLDELAAIVGQLYPSAASHRAFLSFGG